MFNKCGPNTHWWTAKCNKFNPSLNLNQKFSIILEKTLVIKRLKGFILVLGYDFSLIIVDHRPAKEDDSVTLGFLRVE